MVFIALVCGLFAIVLATYSVWMIAARFKALTDPNDIQRLKGLISKGGSSSDKKDQGQDSRLRNIFWLATHVLGQPFIPFVTWGQRRRLGQRLAQAGLPGWSFAQIYFIQCLCAVITLFLSIWLFSEWHLRFDLWRNLGIFFITVFMWFLPILFLRRRYQNRIQKISRQLPFFLDMVGLGLDAGLNLQASIQLALAHVGHGALHQEWSIMLADMRAGQPRVQALRQLSQRLNIASVRQLIASLIQGESMGFSLGGIIQVYADQQRAQRLMQTEKLALQAPVKMLFPMALCIFPCTFIVLGFPVVVQLMGLGELQ